VLRRPWRRSDVVAAARDDDTMAPIVYLAIMERVVSHCVVAAREECEHRARSLDRLRAW